jgi:nucleoside triphosphatase
MITVPNDPAASAIFIEAQEGCAMPEQRYPEPTARAVILSANADVLLMRSHKWRNLWVLPGGHIELGEGIEDALRREVKEETGLTVHDLRFLLWQEFVYDRAFWEDRHFIFFDFECRSATREATLNDEAEEYQWVPVEKALQLPIDDFTRRAIERHLEIRGPTK